MGTNALILLGFSLTLLAHPLRAQQVDASCPQQTNLWPSTNDGSGPASLAWRRPRVINGQARRLSLLQGPRSDIVALETTGGARLDQVEVGSVDSSTFRSLAGVDSSLLVLYAHGGGGTGRWRAVQIVHVTGCWVRLVFAQNVSSATSGPDSFVVRDSAAISFRGAQQIQIRGRRDMAVFRQKSRQPTGLPNSACDYEASWTWDRGAASYIKQSVQQHGSGCESAEMMTDSLYVGAKVRVRVPKLTPDWITGAVVRMQRTETCLAVQLDRTDTEGRGQYAFFGSVKAMEVDRRTNQGVLVIGLPAPTAEDWEAWPAEQLAAIATRCQR